MQNPFEEIINRLTTIENLLAVKINQQESPASDRWMSIKELSTYLPGKPSLPQIYNWTHRRIVPVHKMGRRLSFLKSEIDAWLMNNYQMTQKDLSRTVD